MGPQRVSRNQGAVKPHHGTVAERGVRVSTRPESMTTGAQRPGPDHARRPLGPHPPLVWIASFAVFGAGLAIAAQRWPVLPAIAAGRPWRRWGDLGLWVAATVVYGALLVTTLRNLS